MTVDRTLQSIADVLADHEAAYHPGQLCPEDQHGHCAARHRPVPSPEDRMADARTDTPHTFRTYLDATERDQLDARAACAEQERDEALDARDVVRAQLQNALWTAGQHATTAASLRQRLDQATAERDDARRLAALTAEQEAANAQIIVDTRAERDQARQTADFRQGVIDRHRQELGAAGDVLAVVREAVDRLDRALATYDTTPVEEAEVAPDALSEPQPPDLASWGEREVIAGLRTGAAHRTLQLGAANLIERLIRERGVAPLGSPPPRAQEQPATAATGLPTGADETLAWMRRHGLGHGAGVGAVLAAVRADLARP